MKYVSLFALFELVVLVGLGELSIFDDVSSPPTKRLRLSGICTSVYLLIGSSRKFYKEVYLWDKEVPIKFSKSSISRSGSFR